MAPPATPRVYGGRFSVEGTAGRGGMSTIYRARDLLEGGTVAVKVLDAEGGTSTHRFQQEAGLLAQLRHPAIVRYVGHGVDVSGRNYLAMEWLEGETLEERLGKGPLGLLQTVQLGTRLLEALAFAHDKGVVHRDLKPSNLFLPGGALAQVKLLDFGIAHRADARRLTSTGTTVGTPMYMSPEQARGDRKLDSRSDLFSLAAVLIECLTGVSPFAGETMVASMVKITLEPVDVRGLCGDVPVALVDVLTAMLAKRAADRPANAAALAAQFGRIAGQITVAEGPQAGEQAPRERHPTRPEFTFEQRILSAVVVWPPPADADGETSARLVGETLAGLGLRIDRFAGGAILVTGFGRGTPADQATQAARCALTLQARLPGAILAVGTGRGMVGREIPGGEVIDRIVTLLDDQPPGAIVIDAATRALVGNTFEIQPAGEAGLLLYERLAEPARALPGRELPCMGRHRELDTLLAVYHECISEPVARSVLVTAPAGAGKSRLRRELLQRVEREQEGSGFQLLVGRADSLRAGAPFGLLGPALLTAAGITGEEPAAIQQHRFLAWVARHLPAAAAPRVAAFLGEMAGVPFPADDLPALRAARADPRVMADQMLISWLAWVEAACRAGPILLVLEDLHWGDAPTVEFVDAALRTVREHPFMVLALARPEVSDVFPGLWAERDLLRMSLPPLTAKACRKLVQQALPQLSATHTDWIVERADGNPFYLEQLLEAVSGEDAARPLGSLPDTVLGMVQARFDALGEYVRRVLRAASVFGQTFRADGLAALLDDPASVKPALEVLQRREVILARPGMEGELCFRHALMRDAAYELLSEEDRRLAHAGAGQFLASHGERNALLLVEHFERGGLRAEAAHHCERAAAQALEANDLQGVILHVARGVRNGAQGETLGAMRLTEAQALRFTAHLADSEVAAAEAMALLRGAARLHAATELISTKGQLARYPEIEALLTAVRGWPEPREHVAAWHQVLLQAAGFLPWGGRIALTEALLREVERAAPERDAHLEGMLQSARGLMELNTHPWLAVDHFRKARTAFEAASDLQRAFEARFNLVAALGSLGKLEETERHLQEQLADIERMNLRVHEPIALQNLGIVRADRGDLDGGRATVEAALASARRQGDRRVEGVCHHVLAVIDTRAGRFGPAEVQARAAVDQAVAAVRPMALAGLAGALRGQGRVEEALVEAREANRILEEQGFVDDNEALIRLTLVECLLSSGDSLAAREAGLRAYRRLIERALAIGDPEARKSFLSVLPDHRRTLELAEQLGLASPDH